MLLLAIIILSVLSTFATYTPDWPSIDSRPVPTWFDDVKLGIFSHWGAYSVPAYGSEWFWWRWQHEKDPGCIKFMQKHFPNGTTYADFANLFTAIDFDAQQFADIIKASGARYFVLTSKHHEGFTMWPSATSWNWNAVDIGPHRDLVQELAESIRSKGLHFGLYFSEMDWFHPLYLRDKKMGTKDFPQQVQYPQLLEIVNQYQPKVIWSDGDWEMSDDYWSARNFLAWLYNDSPVKDSVCVNDRWGIGIPGKHGGFMTYGDHYDPGHLQPRKWENCLTLDKLSWGYRRDIRSPDVLTLKEIITQLARTISCGGNMLLNVGPDHTGRIVPIFEERLRAFGQWIQINQEAIYGTKPWINQTDGADIWYTSKVINSSGLNPHRLYNPQDTFNTVIYAYLLNIPRLGRIQFPSIRITDKTRVTILGTQIKVAIKKSSATLWVDLSGIAWQDLPSTEVLVLKVEYAASSKAHPVIREVKEAMRWKYNMRRNSNVLHSSSSSSSFSVEEDTETNQIIGRRNSNVLHSSSSSSSFSVEEDTETNQIIGRRQMTTLMAAEQRN